MRDIVLALIIFGTLPFILFRPYIGVLCWSWLGFMNPHRLTYGFAHDFPFAAIVGGVTLLSLILSREPKRIPWSSVTILLLMFVLWTSVTTAFSFFPETAIPEWKEFLKISLMTFVVIIVMAQQERLHYLVWIIVLSLGFYGIKGGLFTIISGGNYRVLGPEGSFFSGNNEMAFALILVLPLMRYLQLNSKNMWIRNGLSVAMILTLFSILGSYSRGAFLALLIMGLLIWAKGRKKLLISIVLLFFIPLMISFMPQKWHERINSIETYEEDQSAMGRIFAWEVATNIALDRPLVGGGFGAFDWRIYPLYAPKDIDLRLTYVAGDAHSIYFEVLGEQGFVGLLLFLFLGIASFRTGSWVIQHARNYPDLIWASDLAAMTQVSLVGYAVGGAFLGLAYFDLFYTLIAILVIIREIVGKSLEEKAASIEQQEKHLLPVSPS